MQNTKINKTVIVYSIIILALLAVNIYSGLKFYNLRKEIDSISSQNDELDNKKDQTEADYIKFKSDIQSEKAKYNQSLESILPSNEDVTDLNRQIEDFANSINTNASPLYLEKISYGKSIEDKNATGIFLLPFSMNFKASQENFYKMLKFIENSGNIENKVRLMEISKITANFQDSSDGNIEEESTVKLYTFQIEANAYFYKSN